MDRVWIVIDPVLGEVSCDDRESAIAYATGVGGCVACQVWADGELIETIAD